jgi:UDP-glucose 4-epimerase
METVLVTGAAGLLGNHLCRSLLKDGFRVIGIDNLEGGYRQFLPEGDRFKFYKFDLNEPKKVNRVFEKYRPTTVFHFAAYAAEGLSPYIRRFNYTNNILASSSIINACIKFDSKVVFSSSMGVYGNQTPPFTEEMSPKPVDPYGVAKFAIELDLEAAKSQFGLKYSIVRPHNVVGIYQNIWDRYRNVLGIFVRQSLSGTPLTVYGDGLQLRAFSDVKFYMDPFKRLISAGDGEVFNIGADSATSIIDVAEMVVSEASKHGIKSNIDFLEPRQEVKFAYCNHDKAKQILKFDDRTNLEALISELFNWAKQQKPKRIKNLNYEIDKGLYSYWK